ncbi:ABC transporter substrate-binding protein [Vagococcus humatus]|nr:ABC transporter substrate-binding protein [Vagococcus humatus]
MLKAKTKKITGLLFLMVLSLVMIGCTNQAKSSKPAEKKDQPLTQVSLILDYLPNTNHTGIYVAEEKGYYQEQGIKLTIVEPGDDTTSIGLLGANKGEFGLSYQEDLTYAAASKQRIPVTAVATVLEHNTSGFVSMKSSHITRPKDFEGKVYAGWQSPSEEAVLKAVMTNDQADYQQLKLVGSSGNAMAGLGKEVDIKWFFEGWDYTQAVMDGYQLDFLPLRKLDKRLDYYTPIILATDKVIKEDPDLVRRFLKATKQGYQYAIDHPEEGANILHKKVPEYDLAFLKKSQAFVSKHYTDDPSKWGEMKQEVWDNYTDFMLENQLITKKIPAKTLYTNEFLSEGK